MDVTLNTSSASPSNVSNLGNGTTQYGGYARMIIEPVVFDIYNIYLYLMTCLGVPENLMVLIVFARHRPTTTTDWFIVFMTVCDFISFSVNVPVYATFTNGFWRLYGTTLICRTHMFISQTLVLSSSFLISGLALDRYIKVCRQKISLSKAKVRNGCIATMVMTSLLSVPCFVMFENRSGRCISVVMDEELFAYYLMVFFTFLFAVMAVVFSYIKVTKAVIRSEKNVKRHGTLLRNNKVIPISSNKTSGLFKEDTQHNMASMSRTQVSNYNSINGIAAEQCLNVSVIGNEPSFNQNLVVTGNEPSSNQHLAVNTGRPRQILPATTQTQQVTNSSTRTTKIAFWVCSVFILSWIPPWVSFFFVTVPSLRTNINVIQFMMFGRMTYLLNGVANPILYVWLNRKFRIYIKETICLKKS